MDVPEESVSVVFNEISYGETNQIELFNSSSAAVDLSNFWISSGPQTEVQIGTLTPNSGSITSIGQGAFLVLSYELSDNQGTVGLYSANTFDNAEALVDFVQYGASGHSLEAVAVEAGIWNEGDFVPNVRVAIYSIEFDGTGNSSSDWNEVVNPSFGLSNDTLNETTVFNIQMTKAIDFLNAIVFDQRLRTGEATEIGNLDMEGDSYQISFQAVPDAHLSLVTKIYDSNDQFLSSNPDGLDLFPNGDALTGEVNGIIGAIYDLSTEANNGLEALAQDGNSALAVAYLESLGIPVAASSSATNRGPGGQLFYTLEVPNEQGYKLGFAVKFNESNDWFFGYDNAGFPLWDDNGVPVSGFGASADSYLYDSGTEMDEAAGFGMFQYPRQSVSNERPADPNQNVRRVRTIQDTQFGKEIYTNEPGTVFIQDKRGGYNLFSIFIEEQ